MAVRVALGIDAEPGNVAVLDWESTEIDWKRRVLMIAEGMGCGEPPNITYLSCVEPLADMVEVAVNLVAETDASLVIIDSAAYACGGEPEKADPTMQYFRALRALGVTTLTIAHQNAEEKTQKPYGNVMWRNSPRACIQVIRSEEDEESVAEVGLYQRKRNYGVKWKPLGFRATFATESDLHWTEGDSVVISEISEKDIHMITDLAEHLPIGKRVRAALAGGRKSVAEMLEDMPDIKEPSLRAEISRMRKGGHIQELSDGDYGLPDGTFSHA